MRKQNQNNIMSPNATRCVCVRVSGRFSKLTIIVVPELIEQKRCRIVLEWKGADDRNLKLATVCGPSIIHMKKSSE